MSDNAENCDMKNNDFADGWVSVNCSSNPSLFMNNIKISSKYQREFEKQQNQLWKQYKMDETRILNQTLDAVNTRKSIRSLQSFRVAVS